MMVLDAARGIQSQTLKLFEVCRLRDIPVMTFINKMDREALDPMALIDEIAEKLALDPAPLYLARRFRERVSRAWWTFVEGRMVPFTRGADSHPAPLPLSSNGSSSISARTSARRPNRMSN